MSESSSTNAVQRAEMAKMRQSIAKAFDSDQYALRITYTDAEGVVTRRVISPIRFVTPARDQLLALCIGREEPRQFALSRIKDVELILASSVQMPEEIIEVQL